MINSPRILIKLGGAALGTGLVVEKLATAIHNYRSFGYQVIIVHGGGPAINSELRKAGIEWNFVNGQRVTTPQMIDVIESTLCGSVNRRLVRQLGSMKLPTVGLSGTDHQMLLCKPQSIELGLVGSIQAVNSNWLSQMLLLPGSPVPIIAPVGVDSNGQCFNINADWAATHLAVSLQVEQLIFLTDQVGILDEEGRLIPEVDSDGIHNLIDCRMVQGGMLAKANAILHALENGVQKVCVQKAHDFENSTTGTQCSLSQSQYGNLHAVGLEAHASI